MPYNANPLSNDKVQLIKDWIDAGAPNCTGEERFPQDGRDKWYVVNQGCDMMSVIDAESGQVMRYFNVGDIQGFVESPHIVKLSPDKEFVYLVFLANNPYIEKYRTSDDQLVGKIEIGYGDWNTIATTPDGKFGYAIAYQSAAIAGANLETMTPLFNFTMQENVHGSAMHS